MKSNFQFLKDDFLVLAKFGELAKQYCYNDSTSCLMKLGMIGETIVNLIFTYDWITLPQNNTLVNRIDTLFCEGMITRDFADILHALRRKEILLLMRTTLIGFCKYGGIGCFRNLYGKKWKYKGKD